MITLATGMIYENIFNNESLSKDTWVRVLDKIEDNVYMLQGTSTNAIEEVEIDLQKMPRTQQEVESDSLIDDAQKGKIENDRAKLKDTITSRQQKRDDAEFLELMHDPHKAMLGLQEKNRKNSFFMGLLLTEIRNQNLYVQKGFEKSKEGFSQYCKDFLQIEYRKAMLLIQANIFTQQFGVTSEVYSKIGYMKMVELEKISRRHELSEKELEEYINDAQTLSRENLRTKIKVELSEDSVKATKIDWKFSTLERDSALITESIKEYRKNNDTPEVAEMSDSDVIVSILTEYAINQDRQQLEVTEEVLEEIANAKGYTLTALDTVDNEVQENTLEEVETQTTTEF